jgi:cell division protein FtsQ
MAMSEAPSPRKRNNRLEAEDEAAASGPASARPGWGKQLLWSAGKLALVGALLAVCMGGVIYAANRFFTSSPRFAVAKVEAEGSRRYGQEQLLHLAGVQRGDNLFRLELAELEQRLTQDPWIATAKVSRRLPDTLKFVVTEHVAVALAQIDSVTYLVTRQGLPITPLGAGDNADLPVISGVTTDDLQQDRARALERVAQGIAIAERYARLPLGKVHPPQEVHMGAGGSVWLTVGESGITLALGKGPVKQRLLMAARVIGKVRERGQTPQVVFLDNEAHPERVVVRLR